MMARMQVAHGWHQGDAMTLIAPAGQMRAQFGDAADGADHA